MKFSKRTLIIAGAISGTAYMAINAVPYYRIFRIYSCAGGSDELSAACKSVLEPSAHDKMVHTGIMVLSYVCMAVFSLVVIAYITGGHVGKKSKKQ